MDKASDLENHKVSQLLKKLAVSYRSVRMESLHEHLRVAMMLEFSTIPPYMCALYSIENGDSTNESYEEIYGDNAQVAAIIRSVMMEEMLHLTLAANILNAVNGEIKFNHEDYIPEYPTVLPHSAGKFYVHLSKFDRSAIETFLRIEEPTPPQTEPKLDDYTTIGQFYEAILDLMTKLETSASKKGKTIFTGDINLQIDANYYYGGGGKVLPVNNLKMAKKAIKIIMEQGEGSQTSIYDTDKIEFGQIRDLAHYFKYKEIHKEQKYAETQIDPREPPSGSKLKIKYDKVYNMGIDPKTRYFESQDLKILSKEFNKLYRRLLELLQSAFTGNQEELIMAVSLMYKMKYKALELMRNPIPGKNFNAGPTFEFISDVD